MKIERLPTLPDGYTLTAEIPGIDDYRRLRIEAGMTAKSLEAATLGLPNTLFGVANVSLFKILAVTCFLTIFYAPSSA